MKKYIILVFFFSSSAFAYDEARHCDTWKNGEYWSCPANGTDCGDGTFVNIVVVGDASYLECVAPPAPVEHCGASGQGTMVNGTCVMPPDPPPPPPPPTCTLNGVTVPNNVDGSCPNLPTPDCNGYKSNVNGVDVPNACAPQDNCYSNGAIIPHKADGSCPTNSSPPPSDNCAVPLVAGVCPPNETISNPDGSCAAGFIPTFEQGVPDFYCVKDPDFVTPAAAKDAKAAASTSAADAAAAKAAADAAAAADAKAAADADPSLVNVTLSNNAAKTAADSKAAADSAASKANTDALNSNTASLGLGKLSMDSLKGSIDNLTGELKKPKKTDCEIAAAAGKHPAGCSELGDPSTDGTELGTKDRPLTFSPPSSGGGSCPAPRPLVLHGYTLSFEWTPICDFMAMARPIVIAAAYVTAALIVLL